MSCKILSLKAQSVLYSARIAFIIRNFKCLMFHTVHDIDKERIISIFKESLTVSHYLSTYVKILYNLQIVKHSERCEKFILIHLFNTTSTINRTIKTIRRSCLR